MDYRILIAIGIIIGIVIIVLIVPKLTEKLTENYLNEDENLEKVREFLKKNTRKLRNVLLTEIQFNEIQFDDEFVLYYFPEECPSYEEDILLYEETDCGERYYLPEQYSLIKVLPEHKWTKEFQGKLWDLKRKVCKDDRQDYRQDDRKDADDGDQNSLEKSFETTNEHGQV